MLRLGFRFSPLRASGGAFGLAVPLAFPRLWPRPFICPGPEFQLRWRRLLRGKSCLASSPPFGGGSWSSYPANSPDKKDPAKIFCSGPEASASAFAAKAAPRHSLFASPCLRRRLWSSRAFCRGRLFVPARSFSSAGAGSFAAKAASPPRRLSGAALGRVIRRTRRIKRIRQRFFVQAPKLQLRPSRQKRRLGIRFSPLRASGGAFGLPVPFVAACLFVPARSFSSAGIVQSALKSGHYIYKEETGFLFGC